MRILLQGGGTAPQYRYRCQAAEEQQLEIQQHIAQLEHALQQLKAPAAPGRVAVSPQSVEALLKQSRALRVRVQVQNTHRVWFHSASQELEAERAAAKKKHDAALLLWEGRTSGLQAEVDALARQAEGLQRTGDELQSQLAVATQQAQRVQDPQEFAAQQARCDDR